MSINLQFECLCEHVLGDAKSHYGVEVEQNERLLSEQANAVVDPRAVVIEIKNAAVAVIAVFCVRRLEAITCLAILTNDFVDDCVPPQVQIGLLFPILKLNNLLKYVFVFDIALKFIKVLFYLLLGLQYLHLKFFDLVLR